MSVEKTNENNREIDRLVEYFKFYDGIEPIQNPNEINADGQFKTLAVSLNERLCKHNEGTIIDIGCGHGALLEALCGMKSFETSKWFYIGTDKEENIDIVRKLAFDKKVNRRVELVSLDEFYSKAVTDFDTPQPYKFICRNVLHELSIQETAIIVQYWCLNMRDGELFLQDLLSFKNGERGNVCWSRNELENVLDELGFKSAIYDFTGKDNVKWLTGIISFDSGNQNTFEKIKELIKCARLRQFNEYINDFSEKTPERIDIINKDLQLASLCHLLFEEGLEIALPKRENSYAMTIFQVALEQFNPLKSATNILPATPNFRDRAKPQDWLQENITSEGNRCYVYGGRKIGKTYLINYVLERRSYERTVITTEKAIN